MAVLLGLRKNLLLLLSCSLVIVGVIFRDKFIALFNNYKSLGTVRSNHDVRLFTEEQLAKFDGGVNKRKLYLAIMGSVYDVSKGKQHYEKGASYHYFVGKDGSRAFVTGDFKDESADKDHILNLKCDELSALLHWKETFKRKYKPVGLLIGRYYDEQGNPTEYSDYVQQRLADCEVEKELTQRQEQNYPPCNMEWSVESGSRVWCTKTSGGISRHWSGVPRLLYTPGEDQPRCVCVDLSQDHSQALLKEYSDCSPTAAACTVKDK